MYILLHEVNGIEEGNKGMSLSISMIWSEENAFFEDTISVLQ
jgi:hypothetical protein